MTVVLALISDDNEVVMGCDSAGVTGDELDIRSDSKMFFKNGCLFGFCGSFRVCQLVKYYLDFAKFQPKSKMDPFEYVVKKVVVPLQDMLKQQNVPKDEEDFSFIIGFHSSIFVVSADFQVAESRDGFCAIGAGAQIAKGALYVAKKAGCFSSKNAVVMGLKAAERYSTEVRGPFMIETIGLGNKENDNQLEI